MVAASNVSVAATTFTSCATPCVRLLATTTLVPMETCCGYEGSSWRDQLSKAAAQRRPGLPTQQLAPAAPDAAQAEGRHMPGLVPPHAWKYMPSAAQAFAEPQSPHTRSWCVPGAVTSHCVDLHTVCGAQPRTPAVHVSCEPPGQGAYAFAAPRRSRREVLPIVDPASSQ
jgi:hypothetical protein